MIRRLLPPVLGLAIAFLGLAQDSSAQQTQPKPGTPTVEDQDDVVRITTNLVQVDVVVTKNGKVVKGLTGDDFQIFEDGRRQTITNFAYISNVAETSSSATGVEPKNNANLAPLPVTVKPNEARRIMALVVDDLGLSAESMSSVRKQLSKFVDEQMQPNDVVAIIRTGADIGALQQFTNDKRVLREAIKQAQWNLCSRVGSNVFAPIRPTLAEPSGVTEGPSCGWLSVNSTVSSLRFILQAMAELPGRKSMVIFSDSIPRQEQQIIFTNAEDKFGFEGRGNYGLLQRLAEIAIRSSVVIYGVDTQGLQYVGPTAADQVFGSDRMTPTTTSDINAKLKTVTGLRASQMRQRREGAEILAKETGGFLVKNSNDFKIESIMDDQQGYYLIGYRPTDETFNRRFHRISAKVKGSGFTLRTRKGFYGFTEEEAERMRMSMMEKSDSALASPFRATDIAIDLATIFADDPSSGPLLRSYVFMDGKDLTFADDGEGWHKIAVEVRGVIFGNNGQVIDQVTISPTVRVRQQDYELAMRKGLGLRFDIPVKTPGGYQLRVVAKDVVSSRLGSAGQFVTVPNLANRQLAISGILLRPESGNEVLSMTAPQLKAGATDMRSGTPEVSASPALRRFAAGSNLLFGIVIYNATVDANKQPKLTMEAKVFRDDKLILAAEPMRVDLAGQKDLARIFARGLVALKSELEPGRYYLQLEIKDSLAKDKHGTLMQWIDFEVVQA